MDYAVIENGMIVNVVWLLPNNADDFPNVVPLGDVPAGIGDTYNGIYFYHNGKRILTELERMEGAIANLDSILLETQYQNLIGGLE